MTIFEPVFERLLQRYTAEAFKEEISEAKREFFNQAGILNEEENSFELRMSQFLDWYIFTRELSQHHVAPVRLAIHDQEMTWSEGERQLVDGLNEVRHSLFEFLKSKGKDIYVRDLFDGTKFVLRDSEVNVGFNRDEIFEARLLPFENNYHFAKGFCFHPSEVRKFILKEVKKVKKLTQEDREALMLRLLKMRYKHEQYGHIRLDYIYTNDSKLKF